MNNITITGGMNEKRTHRPEDGSAVGQYLVKGLVKNVQEKEIPLFVNADVKEITEKDGKVNGVKVLFNQTEEKTITADAVVVTTGGFGANMDLISEVRPDLEGYVTTNQIGSTGDGIKMIEKLGGTTVDMDQIQVHPTVQQEKSYLIGEAVRGEGAILVSSEGTRFTNELDTRDKVTASINTLPEKAATLVFDSGVKSRVKAIEQYDKMGFVIQADSIEALVKKSVFQRISWQQRLILGTARLRIKRMPNLAELQEWTMICPLVLSTLLKLLLGFTTPWVV